MIKAILNRFSYMLRQGRAAREFKKRNIYVHPHSELGSNTTIGYGTNINGPAYISSTKESPVVIGRYCAIAHNLRIRPRNHYIGFPNLQDRLQRRFGLPLLNVVKGEIAIGNNVWIGDNVIILPGVRIGNGAVIGAGSIVTKDVQGYSVVAGNPATLIKMRFVENIATQLEEIKWWDWTEEKIEKNRRFFETKLQDNPEVQLRDLIVS